MAYSILVIDDEALTLRTIGRALQGEGYEVRVALSGEEGLKLFNEEATELALVDVVLPGIDGIEVLRQIKKRNSAVVVLMMSAYHVVDRAVESMKLGAYDYLIKPFHIVDMLNTVRRASEMLTLHVRVRDSVQTEQGRYDFGKVVTRNPGYREMLEMARKAAESDRTTVLIQGESGTGKEVLAKAIHLTPARARRTRWWNSIARPCPTRCWKANCLATNRALLPTPGGARKGCWKKRTAGHCFSTKSETCRSPCKQSCCGYWNKAAFCVSAEPSRSTSTSA